MDPFTHRIATMGAITRAPRIRRHVWVRRLKNVWDGILFAGAIYLIFMIFFAGG
jgi:hypothetical protein